MDPTTLSAYRQRIETDLRANILPFWMEHVADGERGTFHAELSHELVVDDSKPRGALLSARILWTYAAAFRVYGGADLRAMADFAYADLIGRFADEQHGGFYWSIHPDGSPERTRKQVYGQAFAIYALTEYHRATAGAEPLRRAQDVFERLEKHAKDPARGGYFEAFGANWSSIADMRLSDVDQNVPKSQNTLLHVMEAYTNLLRVWPNDRVRSALHALVVTMVDHVVHPEAFHLGLFFQADWTPTSQRISYGHDIEAAWLLWEAAQALDDEALRARLLPIVMKIAEVTLAEGVDADGAIFNEGGPTGVTDDSKEWWPQAEGVVGFINAAQLSGDDRYLAAAFRLWDFIEARLIDPQGGEWFRGVKRNGEIITTFEKVGFWKCPYHNGRAAMEAIARLNALGAW
ncbi:AGE family epimerase/isomerase [Synoicihabitans lomoniglobus]|uniref:Cellobiose 2-epimerase n=1 Tax=Synoicihabitans lomoniglobus TaxID=2909285 RepID=A0AAE9ZSM0_9BACT|nr:AGE family epimerase/isomerase [Opitutaceae bacterium LMO-M01]WED63511.1 AGE family epimerase/isomerase [Opitutaceae bacterium LMO-M01]